MINKYFLAKMNIPAYLKKFLYNKYGRAHIPSEYTEVEYLESTGTQYIDTGIVPNSDSGFKTKIVFTGHTNGVDDFLIRGAFQQHVW